MINNRRSICFFSGCCFNGLKCLIWHQRKDSLSLFLMLIKHFFEFLSFSCNSMCELPGNGLKLEILTYSVSIDSIIQPNPSLIQLSVLLKTSWKDFPRLSTGPITILLAEKRKLEQIFSLYFLWIYLTKLSV